MKFGPIVMSRQDPHYVRHATVTEAQKEAERLAKANPGKQFCVYIPVGIVDVPEMPVRKTPIVGGTEDDDIPF